MILCFKCKNYEHYYLDEDGLECGGCFGGAPFPDTQRLKNCGWFVSEDPKIALLKAQIWYLKLIRRELKSFSEFPIYLSVYKRLWKEYTELEVENT
jgi:hypothetical protein